jgi:hypothetical protein
MDAAARRSLACFLASHGEEAHRAEQRSDHSDSSGLQMAKFVLLFFELVANIFFMELASSQLGLVKSYTV